MTMTEVRSTEAAPAPDELTGVRPGAKADALPAISGVVIGYLVGHGENNVPLIDFKGNPRQGPVTAACLVALGSEHFGRQVALQFQQGDVRQPVILGLLHGSALMTPDDTPANATPALQTALGRVASEEEVVLTATRKLTLQCGAASISLDLDGNIEIRGENLLSRASRQNRIKGSSISLN